MKAWTSRLSDLEGQVAALESDKAEAVSRMEEALSKETAAEAKATEAITAEENTRAEMAVSMTVVSRIVFCPTAREAGGGRG